MTTLLVLLSLLLFALLLWVLFAPIRLEIDTDEQLYHLQWQGIGQASLRPVPGDVLLQLRILFWKKDVYPLHFRAKAQKKKPAQKQHIYSSKKVRYWSRKTWRVLQSFQVQQCQLRLDTDDYVQNAYLYPVFYFLSKNNRQLSINYQGDVGLKLRVHNKIGRMIRAFFF